MSGLFDTALFFGFFNARSPDDELRSDSLKCGDEGPPGWALHENPAKKLRQNVDEILLVGAGSMGGTCGERLARWGRKVAFRSTRNAPRTRALKGCNSSVQTFSEHRATAGGARKFLGFSDADVIMSEVIDLALEHDQRWADLDLETGLSGWAAALK